MNDMKRIDRITAILIQLQSKRIVTAKEIAGRFNISIRTVYRDIKTLEAAGIPIGSDAGLGYYLVEGYRLPPFKFSQKEVAALITAEKLIDRFTEPSLKEDFDSALYKIKAVLNARDRDYAEELQKQNFMI